MLFTPLWLGRYKLSHRVVMAPLTPMRAGLPGNVPTELAAEYYGQRASAGGLIIAEATQVGQGYPTTPGIHSEEQVVAWRKVTSAVHAKGGIIFLQLWHAGRISHSSFQPERMLPVAPSAIAAPGNAFTPNWEQVPFETPRALEIHEIVELYENYREAARNAVAADFDGVELHGANGYLVEQFLHSRSNHRTDAYGGSVQNRVRFLADVTAALVDVWGADRVGVRLSPFGTINGVGDPEPIALYRHALSRLFALDVAYVHLIESRDRDAGEVHAPLAVDRLRPFWRKPLIVAGGFAGESAEMAVRSGRADAVAFGRHFIANPDLPHRLKVGAPLNPYDRATFYGGRVAGYVD